MASQISTEALVEKARRFLTTDVKDKVLDYFIRDAIIQADRELRECDSLSPLAWDIVPYDELRTVYPANISAITQANPGVITAATTDSTATGHGFHNHATIRDIVTIEGIDGMEELNTRMFLLEYVDADTFSLKTLDGLTDINTTSYAAYSSGGAVYHSGFVLNTTTMLANVSSEWTVKSFLPDVTFDGHPTTPISEEAIRSRKYIKDVGYAGRMFDAAYASRPRHHRFWLNMTDADTTTYNLFWYPAVGAPYNVSIRYQKEIPDISAWTASTYPFHPAEAHDALWHGALAHLVGNSKRVQRSTDKEVTVQLEVMFGTMWIKKWEDDKKRIRNLSRRMMGAKGGTGGLSA